MCRTTSPAVFAIAATIFITPAFAQVSYVSQTRSIRAFAPGLVSTGLDDTRTAPDFGVFDQSASSTASDTQASAHQRSILNATGIHAEFYAFATRQNGFNAIANSLLDVTFSLAAPSPYSLAGPYDGIVQISLTGSSGQIAGTPAGSTLGTLNASGVLQPGTYRLQARVFADNTGPTLAHPGSATLDFLVPTPTTPAIMALALMAQRRRRPTVRATVPTSSARPASA